MKRAYSPQARTRSSPKLVRYGVASVKPTALKQLWNAAVRVRRRPFALAHGSTAQSMRRGGGAHGSLWRTLPSCRFSFRRCLFVTPGAGLSPHETEWRISMSKSAKSHHPNQRTLRQCGTHRLPEKAVQRPASYLQFGTVTRRSQLTINRVRSH